MSWYNYKTFDVDSVENIQHYLSENSINHKIERAACGWVISMCLTETEAREIDGIITEL